MNNKKEIKRVLQGFEEFKKKLSVIIPKLENIKNFIGEQEEEIEHLLKELTLISQFMSNLSLIRSNLKKIKKMAVFFRKFGDLSKYPTELQEFRNDLNNYGPGTFLWMENKYPHISEIQILLGWKSPVLRIKNIEKIVNQYYKLLEKVKSLYPQLFEEEYNYTMSFFENEIKPINLISEYPSYKKINNLLIPDSLDDIKEFLDNLPELTMLIEEKGLLQIKNEDIPLKIRKLSNKMEKDTKVLDELISDLKSDSNFTIKILLEQIQNFDSFNINFIKILIRLKHIFETGNKNYRNYYSLKEEYSRRKYLREDLNDNLFDEFKDLRIFLLNYLEQFVKLRNICSHRTPKPKLSKNKKYALIHDPKKGDFIKIHIEKTKKLVMTYAYFIEALKF